MPWSFFVSVMCFANWFTWPIQHYHDSHQKLSVFLIMTSVGLSVSAWVLTPPTLQAQLSLSRRGLEPSSAQPLSRGHLGLWLSHHSFAASISFICSSGFGPQSVHHLSQAIMVFNNLVSPEEAISAETVLLSPPTKKLGLLPSKLDDYLFNHLLNLSPWADKARLLSISSTHASAWMSVTPSESFGLHLDYQIQRCLLTLKASMAANIRKSMFVISLS